MSEECEFGTADNVRFLPPGAVTMHDSSGKEVLCKCGKPAGSALIGKKAYIAWCEDCVPYKKETAKFIYKPPNQLEKQKLVDNGFIIP